MNRWILASRPKTLFAAAAPVVVGTALAFAQGVGHWPAALAALLGSLLIQIGTNFTNDYVDFFRGADRADRLGPTRVTQAGMVTPVAMRRATILVFALAVAVGLYLVWRGGLPILLVGVLAILSGILYTAGPYPLAYLGAADLFVLIFFGFVAVAGTYYVQALTVTPAVLLAGLGPGLYSTAILAVNNLRDREQDARAGKRTLAVRFGREFARAEYLICVVGAGLTPLLFFALSRQQWGVLLATLTLIPTLPAIRSAYTESGPALNRLLARTGQLLMLYSLLFSVGLLIV